jgi:hypothetical protein
MVVVEPAAGNHWKYRISGLFTGALLYLTYGASPQRGKEPVLLESKSPVGLAAEGA